MIKLELTELPQKNVGPSKLERGIFHEKKHWGAPIDGNFHGGGVQCFTQVESAELGLRVDAYRGHQAWQWKTHGNPI